MSLVEKISQMQKMGMTDEQIVKYLRDEGISPREISEAVDQFQVKSAVESPKNVLEGMSPSLMSPGPSLAPPEKPAQESQPPQKQAVPPTPQAPEEEPQEEYYPEEQAYQEQPYPAQQPAEQYAEQQYYPEQPGAEQSQDYGQGRQGYDYQDTGAISDIAEQIVDEKLQKIEKEVSDILRFKIETDGRLASLNERVRRIELIIDSLQSSILGKIGGYEKDISNLKQELETTQESFSKVLEPLPEKQKTIEHPVHKPTHKEAKHHKKSDALAHYLRR